MIRTLWNALPGPTPVRISIAAVAAVVALVALFFFYDWVGTTFLDTGGAVG
ncbi:MAG: hypothetical protein R3246_15125 [Acidimicrobiia bacterium]|nr:hypothetical protein [Acidimicrobiia bacterium]